MDPITLIGLVAPLFIKGGSALISRFIAPKEFRPSTIDEWEKMQRLDMDKFKTMNEAGGTNPTYAWVEAVVRLQRPFVVALTLIVWALSHLAPMIGLELSASFTGAVDNATAAVCFYLFGERTMLGTAGAGNNGITTAATTASASRPTIAPAAVAAGRS